MGFIKNNYSMIIILISIYFHAHVSATVKEYEKCIRKMNKYCGVDLSLHPRYCAQRVLVHWTLEDIQNGYVRIYHEHLKSHLIPGEAMDTPLEFCVYRDPRCSYDLDELISAEVSNDLVLEPESSTTEHDYSTFEHDYSTFEHDARTGILRYAFSHKSYSSNLTQGNHMTDYLKHLAKSLELIDTDLDGPETFCRKRFLLNEENLFDVADDLIPEVLPR